MYASVHGPMTAELTVEPDSGKWSSLVVWENRKWYAAMDSCFHDVRGPWVHGGMQSQGHGTMGALKFGVQVFVLSDLLQAA